MRIIGGANKGYRFKPLKNLPVRPTTDKVKESLFNILNHKIDFESITLLDLFAGTGNISFEFASRGTKKITLVDSHRSCIKSIYQNSKELSFDVQILHKNVFQFLKNTATSYDVIFADPPYDFSQKEYEELHSLVFENNMLNKEGIFILEHSSKFNFESFSYFENSRKYGDITLSFFYTKE